MGFTDSAAKFFATGTGRYLLLAARVAMGVVFIAAAYGKLHVNDAWHLGDYHFLFAMTINSYQMGFPTWAVLMMGRFLPLLEPVLGVLLITGIGLRWVSAFVSLLLVVFIGAMARAAMLGLQINCGCFGNNEQLGALTLTRDSSFLLLSLFITAGAFLARRAAPRSAA
jgi:putative oxidoreductase